MSTFKRNPRPQLPGQDPKTHVRRADPPVRAGADLAPTPTLCPKCRGPLGVRTALSQYGKALETYCLPCGRSWHVVGVEVASMFHSTREYRTWNELNGAVTSSR
jgi:hypothetical protein